MHHSRGSTPGGTGRFISTNPFSIPGIQFEDLSIVAATSQPFAPARASIACNVPPS